MIKIIITQDDKPDAVRWYARIPVKGDLLMVDGRPVVALSVRLNGQDRDPVGRPDILTNITHATVYVGPKPSFLRRLLG